MRKDASPVVASSVQCIETAALYDVYKVMLLDNSMDGLVCCGHGPLIPGFRRSSVGTTARSIYPCLYS